MARGRMVSKSLSTSRKFFALFDVAGPLAEFCQSLFPLIVAHADDFGRLQGDPFTVKQQCHPASPRPVAEFEQALKALDDVGLITRYRGTGDDGEDAFIQIVKFEKHQQGLHKRTRSHFPPPPGCSETPENPPEQSDEFPGVPGQENRREGNRTEEVRSRGRDVALSGALPREHLNHVACDESFSYCVPATVHAKLSGLLAPRYGNDRDKAKPVLLAWYPQVWQRLPAGFVMPDAFKFWQAQFDSDFADQATTTAKRANEPRQVIPKADETQRLLDERRRAREQVAS